MSNYSNSNRYGSQRFGGYNERSNERQANGPKHSGAKMGYTNGDETRPWISAWNFSKARGMISLIASPRKTFRGKQKSEFRSAKTGKIYCAWVIKVAWKRDGRESLHDGMYDVALRRLVCMDLNLVINPHAPNGGYCGRGGGK